MHVIARCIDLHQLLENNGAMSDEPQSIAQLTSMGPKSEAMLAQIGIHSAAEFLALDPYDVYARLQQAGCLLYTSPSPRDRTRSRMPSSA